ncbi:YdbH domain-containing protein [uncultured Sphingomonas sp.]|uniref:intermembrane phospholipid transport protein YdbH family protein n=1 Tax=uncultured Sphingomonas sp. TaxID=158754 RepID=UPI0035C979E6
MTQESDEPSPGPARFAARGAAIVLGLFVLLLLGVWIARRPIAREVIDRRLAAAGVRARYDVADLGFGRQRLVDVVIGDPDRPDLVADWIEAGTRLTWSGASVTALRAGSVRMRGRIVGGRVSLGALDRLLSAPSSKPFALPRLFLDVADARMRLETPAGVFGLILAGRGRLDDGFDGRLAVVSEHVEAGGCAAERVEAAVRVRITDAAPTVVGPIRAARVACRGGGARRVGADLDAALTPALDGWRGAVRLATGAVDGAGARGTASAGTLTFAGSARGTAGRADLALTDFSLKGARARRVSLAGDYRTGGGLRFAGRVRAEDAAVARVGLEAAALAGTPLGPIADGIAAAVDRAARRFGFDAALMVDTRQGGAVRVTGMTARSASGARVMLGGGDGISWSPSRVRFDTDASVGGGGLPATRLLLDQAAPAAPIRGSARVQPYAAGGAVAALAPVSFTAMPGGTTRVATVATLSGPLGDGRIDRLRVPLVVDWDGGSRLALGPGCSPIAFDRLSVAGLTLSPTRLRLCPTAGVLVRVERGRVSGGARIDAPRLAGRLGATPVTLAASSAEVAIGARGFTLRGVAAALGSPGRVTRIEVGRLDGRIDGGAVAGGFADTIGRIANVPLLLSGASGAWRLAGGALTLGGASTVSDAAARRFEPFRSEDIAFRLEGGRIAVTGSLVEPATRSEVTRVRIGHDLARGTGEATLTVPGVIFDEKLQPEALTRTTFGVIADVRGRVAGEGRIAWSPAGVTSTGAFATEGIDLAAAFGPVTGLKGRIVFDDLLALRSAPGQVATIATINSGIPVTDGVVRYQTLPGSRVAVEGGRWPFAGGMLLLAPTTLDFSRPVDRRLTFGIEGMQADQFLQQFDFDNLNATGVFDGELPMVFDERGGRIENGRLRVRGGGGTLAYVGAISQERLGTWGDFAFQSLKSLRYRQLGIVMNGPLAGEMVTDVRFEGVSQGAGTKSNFVIRRLQQLPLVFNIRIKAPFRGLIDSARSFYNPARLIERNLPALLEEQDKRAAPPVIQPSASRNVP